VEAPKPASEAPQEAPGMPLLAAFLRVEWKKFKAYRICGTAYGATCDHSREGRVGQ